ncbi:hypothetical protein SMC26_19070 [Actinomadura fulvescens]|uniref:Uncharacterized protein n=1 Tax=Actinomadura fulvescens TaxID=46160 RepID=A0ABN3QHE0_9ACTN
MQLLLHAHGARLAPVGGHVAAVHRVSGVLGEREVNSFHRFAALDVPPRLETLARCGPVVEAVRLMWHPERTQPYDPRDVALFAGAFGR